jgi:tripeptide aminopeptidase
MINQDRIIQTFMELVQIDSPSGEEANIRADLLRRLAALGLETETDNVGNIIARLKEGEGDIFLLGGHMDTVSPGKGIKSVIRDGVIYSDGSTILGSDDKAGLAIMLEVLALLQEKNLPHPPLEVVITAKEELGLQGARDMDKSKLTAKWGLVLDGGGPPGTIVYGAPAQNQIYVTVHGKAAHAGAAPEKGINALTIVAEALTACPLGRIDEETTANFGLIEGGTSRNAVPAEVKLVGETRSRNNAKLELLTTIVVNAFEQTAVRYGASVTMDVRPAYKAFALDKESAVIRAVVEATKVQGYEPLLELGGGGTDANHYNAAGVETAVISAAMTDIHTVNENLPINDFLACAEIVLQTVTGMKM